MLRKFTKILAINPGTRYIGIAIFEGLELLDWKVKTIPGRWSGEKLQKIILIAHSLIKRHKPDVLAIKNLHPSRSSVNLRLLIARIKQLAKRNGLKLYQYSINDIENFFSPNKKINKKKLGQIVSFRYPALFHQFLSLIHI